MTATRRIGGLALLASTLLAGCAAPAPMTAKTEVQAERSTPPGARTRVETQCTLRVLAVEDARQDPTMLGYVAGRAVHSPTDARAWISNALHDLETRGVQVSLPGEPATATAGPALDSEVRLKLAWLTDISMAKSGTAVVQFRFSREGVLLLDKDYRGTQTGINWNSSEGELQHLVDAVWSNLLDQVAADLKQICTH